MHADTAQVHAEINPGGGETTYHVAYGTTSSYGSLGPIPDAKAGSGRTLQSVTVQLSALTPGTTYHYQVVAQNATETTKATRPYLHDPAFHQGNHRHLPQLPRPPADRRRPTPRLSRLRAGLRGQYRRL